LEKEDFTLSGNTFNLLDYPLFPETESDVISQALALLDKNKVLFLIGTEELESLSDFSGDQIFIHTVIIKLLKKDKNLTQAKVYPITLLDSIVSSIKNNSGIDFSLNNPTDNPSSYLFILDNAHSYFDSLSDSEMLHEYAFIRELNKKGIYTIFYLNVLNKNFSYAKVASIINHSIQFIPEVSAEGLLKYMDKMVEINHLAISPDCKTLMQHQIFQQPISLSLISNSLSFIKSTLKNKKGEQILLSAAEFESIGGFFHVAQKQYKTFIVTHYSDQDHHEGITLTTAPQVLKQFFQSFLIKINEKDFNIRVLSIEEIKNLTNLPEQQIQGIIRNLEAYPFPFLKKDLNRYTLFSHDLLNYWEEMVQWKTEERNKIDQYIDLNTQAIFHQNGKIKLLSGSNLEEALTWLNECKPNLAWARSYAPEFELTIQYIENSAAERKANLEASQRRSKRLLKISRAIAFVIGFAFILSTLAAILAGLERNNAIKAKKNAESERLLAIKAREQAVKAKELAESEQKKAMLASEAERMAKRIAEKERLQAIFSRDVANKEKQNALISRNAESKAKEQAQLDRSTAIAAKDVADVERKNAIAARLEVDKALIQASNNFKRAEKLRKQQEARADALNSFRLYLNNQWKEGISLSLNAYLINQQNEGNPYESEIVKSIVYGLSGLNPKAYIYKLNQPLKNIAINQSGNLLAAFSIGGQMTIFQPNFIKIAEFNIPYQKFQSFCFTPNNQLLVGMADGTLHLYDPLNGSLKWSRFISTEPIKSVTMAGENQFIFCSGNNIFIMKGISLFATLIKKSFPVSKSWDKICLGINPGIIYAISGQSIYTGNYNDPNFENDFKKLVEIPNLLRHMAVKKYRDLTFLLLGDDKGQTYLVNALSGDIVLNKKAHQSAVSKCHLAINNDDLIMITSGLDHQVVAEYVTVNENLSIVPKSTVSIDLHTAWVTDMVYHQISNSYFSCSDDMTIRKWYFDPKKMYSLSNSFLNEKSK
jgi:hypothetical protein